jgi:2-polyprenyl-3-methyl-5-hydroxy-6-metoxy-1,4-benzoquinol methylase
MNRDEDSSVCSPLSKSSRCTRVKTIPTETIKRLWQEGLGIDVSENLAGHSELTLYRCDDTGLRFFVPTECAGGEKLYADLQRHDWFYMPWKWEHQILYSSLLKTESVLEVGCGAGAFVERLHSSGYQVRGIEYNSSAVAAARKKHLPVEAMPLREMNLDKDGLFDVVCHFQVLEHVPNPHQFIEDCLSVLRPEGRLVICVPNNDSFLGAEFNILDMPPHHMTQWNARALRSLECLFPIKMRELRYEPLADYHITPYLDTKLGKPRLTNSYRGRLDAFLRKAARRTIQLAPTGLFRGQSVYVEYSKL